MPLVRSRLARAVVLALMLVLAACGKSTTSKTAATQAIATTSTTAPGPTVATANNATLGMVLVDAEGHTLYRNTKETGAVIACTGSCATAWPPLASPGGGATLASGVSGSLGTIARPDGTTQVTYNGMPLYRFASDAAPGDAKGQGIGGIWFAAAPSAAVTPTTAKPVVPASPTTRAPAPTTRATAAPTTTSPPATMAPHQTTCAYSPCY